MMIANHKYCIMWAKVLRQRITREEKYLSKEEFNHRQADRKAIHQRFKLECIAKSKADAKRRTEREAYLRTKRESNCEAEHDTETKFKILDHYFNPDCDCPECHTDETLVFTDP